MEPLSRFKTVNVRVEIVPVLRCINAEGSPSSPVSSGSNINVHSRLRRAVILACKRGQDSLHPLSTTAMGRLLYLDPNMSVHLEEVAYIR